ncbi:MAG: cytochrome P450 [Alphaproteobacteria bacterium]|nr:MAG: cytochrome P450 [Alphaproteobacteria bacterium]
MQAARSTGAVDPALREKVLKFDPTRLDAAFLDNPYPTYHLLRQLDPVHRCPDGSYFLTRYADLNKVYRDNRTFSSDKKKEFRPKFGEGWLYTHHTTSLVFNDPPLHTRVRRLIMGALTPRALRALEPQLVALIDSLLDKAAEKEEIDLINDYAAAIPIQVIGDLLGVPMADRGPLRYWSLTILGALEPVITPDQLAEGNKAVSDFRDYLIDLVADRRRNMRDPEQDVLSRLIAGEADGERLTEEELLQNCIFLLNAGHETTTNLIGNGVACLLEYPDQMERLRGDPGLIKPAVEEFLRFESSNQLGNRITTCEVEIGGVVMPPETQITLCIGAANRDPEEFPDPDRLDISRSPNRHLAFGAGAHACAGMSLARMEGQIAIGRMLKRFSKIERNGEFVRGGRARFRGYLSYPLRVRP